MHYNYDKLYVQNKYYFMSQQLTNSILTCHISQYHDNAHDLYLTNVIINSKLNSVFIIYV